MKTRRIAFIGNAGGAFGDDFHKLSFADLLWLIIGGSLRTGSDVIYLWGQKPND